MKSYRDLIRSKIEESFGNSIKIEEGASQGVPFEWAIVRKAIEKSLPKAKVQARINEYPQLDSFSDKIGQDATSAVSNVPPNLLKLAQHTDEVGVQGDPEPKTDILFGPKHRVSVKMDGPIQLASGEGKYSAKMIRSVVTEMLKKDPTFKDSILEDIVNRIDKMPTKMISPQNLERLQNERPDKIAHMVKNGEILDEYNWRVWEANNKNYIKKKMAEFIENNPAFTYILVDEAMTGRRVFKQNGYKLADANYIITPRYFRKIDKKYVNEMMKKTRIDVRAKSRSGVTSSTVRFDVREEFENIVKEDLNLVNEGVWDAIKKMGSGVKDFISGWWEKLKSRLKNFYRNNIEQVITDESDELGLDLTVDF
jgi:hypothetical protein